VKALGKLRDDIPVKPLVALLYDKDDDDVGRPFLYEDLSILLGQLGEHLPTESLLSAVSHQDKYIRLMGVKALLRQQEQVSKDLLISILHEAAFHDTDTEVRREAATALAALEEEMPIDPHLALSVQAENHTFEQ